MDFYEELRYRRIVPMTHEEYLAEPRPVIRWTLALDTLEQEVLADGRSDR